MLGRRILSRNLLSRRCSPVSTGVYHNLSNTHMYSKLLPSIYTQAQRHECTQNMARTTCVMEGHTLADNILDDVNARAVQIHKHIGRAPHLSVVLVGGREDSRRYIQVKQRAAKAVGIDSTIVELDEDITMVELLQALHKLNSDTNVDGIIIQLPLPPHLNDSVALQSVVPHKDVDGFHLNNQAHLLDADHVRTRAFSLVFDTPKHKYKRAPSDETNTHTAQGSIVPTPMYNTKAIDLINTDKPKWLPHLDPSFFSSIWTYLSFSTLNFRIDLQSVTDTLLSMQERELPEGEFKEIINGDSPSENSKNTTTTTTTVTQALQPVDLPCAPSLLPCTPLSCIALLDHYNVNLSGAHVVVLGRSTVVGFPLSLMLMHRGAAVTNLDKHASPELRMKLCSEADIIVCAVGSYGIIDKSCVKKGAVVLDVGINFVDANILPKSSIDITMPERRWATSKSTNKKTTTITQQEPKYDPKAGNNNNTKLRLVGDADFDSLVDHASMVTPVPGGVGPVTVAMLLYNTIVACEYNNRHLIRRV